MANSYFNFKMFTIRQDRCAMKVGTDGVLLGAWVHVDACASLLDVGTGTGLIALMLAERCTGAIDAIDIDSEACEQAADNVAASPFAGRIRVHHQPFGAYAALSAAKYDLIVSNPPYFAESLKCPDHQRSTARHTDTLDLRDLIKDSLSLLTPAGRIALILPSNREKELSALATANSLHLIRRTNVIPRPGTAPKRILAELSRLQPAECQTETLVIEEARHQYTPEYIELTRDFYLNM